jgi:pyruvate/2-oxoglutarate dehydrogenase complex dihydrolipoamide dehydrogenase (E3) component
VSDVVETYDLIVIGSGTAAQVASAQTRSAGWKVAAIDHRPFGGTCARRGCDPKKMLISGAEAIDAASRVGSHAEEVINIFGLAIRRGLTARDLKTTVFAYPTSASDIAYMV